MKPILHPVYVFEPFYNLLVFGNELMFLDTWQRRNKPLLLDNKVLPEGLVSICFKAKIVCIQEEMCVFLSNNNGLFFGDINDFVLSAILGFLHLIFLRQFSRNHQLLGKMGFQLADNFQGNANQ